jgi:hypothetical protein
MVNITKRQEEDSMLGKLAVKLDKYRRLNREICPCVSITKENFELIKSEIGSRQMVNGGKNPLPGKAVMSYKGTLIYVS